MDLPKIKHSKRVLLNQKIKQQTVKLQLEKKKPGLRKGNTGQQKIYKHIKGGKDRKVQKRPLEKYEKC